MTREQKYDLVNQTETLKGLAWAIRSLANEDGLIWGRTRKFNAEKMAECAENFLSVSPNTLTREFGIRQQALYIKHYLTT